jgi:hypothetical protein
VAQSERFQADVVAGKNKIGGTHCPSMLWAAEGSQFASRGNDTIKESRLDEAVIPCV